MDTRFPRPSARNDGNAIRRPLDDAIPARGAPADLADRACCCSAKPVVRVIMPPTQARRHWTDLLLCGHHYRVSRRSLAAAGARVRELPGTPGDTAAWIGFDSHNAPAQVSR
jgi:hypothetical protein